MVIDSIRAKEGNAAMASVLLLYYHLLSEGGITHDQTVYVDPLLFDPFQFIDVVVADKGLDIDESLLREGAIVHLVCDLDDVISDNEDSYIEHPFAQKIVEKLRMTCSGTPSIERLISLVCAPMNSIADYETYRQILREIYHQYVVLRHEAIGG